MSDLFVILVSTSICGNIIFGLFLLAAKYLPANYSNFVYILMKIAGFFFLFPLIVICIYIIRTSSFYYEINVDLPDFQYIRYYDGLKSWNFLENSIYSHIVNGIVIVWLGGFVFYYLFNILRGKMLIKKILNQTQICKQDKQDLLEEIKAELKIKEKIILCKSQDIHTPMLIGILTPRILLPTVELPNEKWRLLIKHELVHYKNKDLIFKSLIDLIQKLHWFNPVIYLYAKTFYETSELVCDQLTLKNTTTKQRSGYAKLLLALSGNLEFQKAIASFSNNDYLIIERRIHNIMKKQNIRKKGVTILMAIVLLALCPTVSYASTWGVLSLQDKLITSLNKTLSYEVEGIPSTVNYEEIIDDSLEKIPFTFLGSLNARGNNSVDCEVSAGREVHYSSVELSSGSNVKFAITADHTSDKFQVGLIDENGVKRYVSSISGEVITTFSINKAGTYTIYFSNANTNQQVIHLFGFINIY